MKKITIFSFIFSLTLGITYTKAQENNFNNKTSNATSVDDIPPTYLEGVWKDEGWRSNWFFSIQGGINAFVGVPVGHGDLFDRTQPMVGAGGCKWVTPVIGLRVAWQGFRLIDSDIEKRNFNNFHADFMYNLSNAVRKDLIKMSKWDIIPYVGLGLITNSYTKKNNFAISYGFDVRCRLNERFYITGGIGNSMTWTDFDGKGDSNKFGDNLLQVNVGLSVGIGKIGWKRVLDAKPYIIRNEGERDKNNHKIVKTISNVNVFPKNNYSGLNSLRSRLNGGREKVLTDVFYPEVTMDSTISKMIGNPVYFFFNIGSAKLKDKRQLVNIKEIADAAKKYGLRVRVIGSADSKTGTKKINKRLSKKRAETIAAEMKKQNVAQDSITIESLGGVKNFAQIKNNRNSCVILER